MNEVTPDEALEAMTVLPWPRGLDEKVPLISRVDETLWQGGWPGYVISHLPPPFKFVVNIYGREGYTVDPDVKMIVRRWHDNEFLPDLAELEATAAQINEWRALGPTLVHCEGGWNRSGLVAALALIRSGTDPEDAIALLRAKRSSLVLFNPYFAAWLREQG
jgi:hypothetical protein